MSELRYVFWFCLILSNIWFAAASTGRVGFQITTGILYMIGAVIVFVLMLLETK